MKEVANSLMQLFAIIMIMITLAVSSAAVAQWAGSGNASSGTVEAETQAARL